jgi:hypothetical protein
VEGRAYVQCQPQSKSEHNCLLNEFGWGIIENCRRIQSADSEFALLWNQKIVEEDGKKIAVVADEAVRKSVVAGQRDRLRNEIEDQSTRGAKREGDGKVMNRR